MEASAQEPTHSSHRPGLSAAILGVSPMQRHVCNNHGPTTTAGCMPLRENLEHLALVAREDCLLGATGRLLHKATSSGPDVADLPNTEKQTQRIR